jgi:hypothetical protein
MPSGIGGDGLSGQNLFADLESSAAFRADMLYFLRMAGNYMANIFINTRSGAPSKHRRTLAEWLDKQATTDYDDKLLTALKTKKPWFDVYKKGASTLLENMPLPMRDRLARSVQTDHCLPLSLSNFIKMLDELRAYRHWLEHYEERIQKKQSRSVTDDVIARHLGLLLLPHLHNHLIGRVHHHSCKMGQRHFGRPKAHANSALHTIFAKAIAERREATMERMGKRTKGSVIRKERQEAQEAGERWRTTHAARFAPETWPRYNVHNWKIRFYFMGQGRIAQLENLLRPANNDRAAIDFIHAIEPLFNLSLDINLSIHLALTGLEQSGVKVGNKKQVGSIIPAIRNEIAHGGFFWDAKDGNNPLSVQQVFEAVQDLLLEQTNGKQLRNDFVTAIEQHLHKARITLVYPPATTDNPNKNPPPIRIRNWSADNRARYGANSGYRLEKRKDYRRVAAAWMRELVKSREKIDTDMNL